MKYKGKEVKVTKLDNPLDCKGCIFYPYYNNIEDCICESKSFETAYKLDSCIDSKVKYIYK